MGKMKKALIIVVIVGIVIIITLTTGCLIPYNEYKGKMIKANEKTSEFNKGAEIEETPITEDETNISTDLTIPEDFINEDNIDDVENFLKKIEEYDSFSTEVSKIDHTYSTVINDLVDKFSIETNLEKKRLYGVMISDEYINMKNDYTNLEVPEFLKDLYLLRIEEYQSYIKSYDYFSKTPLEKIDANEWFKLNEEIMKAETKYLNEHENIQKSINDDASSLGLPPVYIN